ncbi:MAG: nucleotidyl transferase AbiEii/AbiGii toxin family protein, partial [Candidatus Aureabacteria bacterium]|nr:nucleotidyl transferase AbiEii/AbiGii toxin family protein [Candidatus Auribacterota bacterium]
GEDLFTKVEFSRRGRRGSVAVHPISDTILRLYKLAPLVVPHYDIHSAVSQKIDALAARAVTQPRDIFDLFILSSQYDAPEGKQTKYTAQIAKAHENIFTISFEQFRDTVVSYLSAEDQAAYGNPPMWDEIKLKTAQFLEEIRDCKHV